jgi:hypothetical protein
VEARGLTLGVHARVGAARADHLDGRALPEDSAEASLYGSLHAAARAGARAGKPLPTEEVGAVVGEAEEEIASRHAAIIGRRRRPCISSAIRDFFRVEIEASCR